MVRCRLRIRGEIRKGACVIPGLVVPRAPAGGMEPRLRLLLLLLLVLLRLPLTPTAHLGEAYRSAP